MNLLMLKFTLKSAFSFKKIYADVAEDVSKFVRIRLHLTLVKLIFLPQVHARQMLCSPGREDPERDAADSGGPGLPHRPRLRHACAPRYHWQQF